MYVGIFDRWELYDGPHLFGFYATLEAADARISQYAEDFGAKLLLDPLAWKSHDYCAICEIRPVEDLEELLPEATKCYRVKILP